MASTVSKFKGFIVFAMILLLSQQSFADFFPMNCDDMNNASVALQENHSHMTSQMDMLDHKSSSKGKMASHEECDIWRNLIMSPAVGSLFIDAFTGILLFKFSKKSFGMSLFPVFLPVRSAAASSS